MPIRHQLACRPAFAGLLARGWLSVVMVLAFRLLAGAAEARLPAHFSEEQVKAALLVGFAKTTEWPAGTFKDGPRTLVVGLFAKDTLGEKATRPFQDPAPGTGVAIRFKVVDETCARDCHLLFFPRAERRRVREITERLKNAPILIVGESEDFLDLGGMVNLVPREGQMKFEIDLDAAKAANLRIPAKVLSSAWKVKGRYD